jgi:plastocyanin
LKRLQKVLIAIAGLALLGFGLLSSVHGQGGTDAPLTADQPNLPTSSVAIDNFSFSPASITVPVGTTLTWTNRDDIPHTVASDDQKFKSKALDTDEKFSFTFTEPGTYSYFCSIHPKMVAKVIVEGAK